MPSFNWYLEAASFKASCFFWVFWVTSGTKSVIYSIIKLYCWIFQWCQAAVWFPETTLQIFANHKHKSQQCQDHQRGEKRNGVTRKKRRSPTTIWWSLWLGRLVVSKQSVLSYRIKVSPYDLLYELENFIFIRRKLFLL